MGPAKAGKVQATPPFGVSQHRLSFFSSRRERCRSWRRAFLAGTVRPVNPLPEVFFRPVYGDLSRKRRGAVLRGSKASVNPFLETSFSKMPKDLLPHAESGSICSRRVRQLFLESFSSKHPF